jgi:hypothetical protein
LAEYRKAQTRDATRKLDPPNPMFHEVYLGRAEELLPALLRG